MKKLLAAAVVMLFAGYAQLAAAGLFGMEMGNSDAKTTATGDVDRPSYEHILAMAVVLPLLPAVLTEIPFVVVIKDLL